MIKKNGLKSLWELLRFLFFLHLNWQWSVMKTVRNNPWRPHRVYIETVFTLLCKHLLQDGTLKCEQNSTSTLLDAAVLLQSDKQFECGVHAVCMHYLAVTVCVLAFSGHQLCLRHARGGAGGDICRLPSLASAGIASHAAWDRLGSLCSTPASKLPIPGALCLGTHGRFVAESSKEPSCRAALRFLMMMLRLWWVFGRAQDPKFNPKLT